MNYKEVISYLARRVSPFQIGRDNYMSMREFSMMSPQDKYTLAMADYERDCIIRSFDNLSENMRDMETTVDYWLNKLATMSAVMIAKENMDEDTWKDGDETIESYSVKYYLIGLNDQSRGEYPGVSSFSDYKPALKNMRLINGMHLGNLASQFFGRELRPAKIINGEVVPKTFGDTITENIDKDAEFMAMAKRFARILRTNEIIVKKMRALTPLRENWHEINDINNCFLILNNL